MKIETKLSKKKVRSVAYVCMLLILMSGKLVAQPPAPSGKKWEKIENLSDEFNGSSLDLSKWAMLSPEWEGRKPARFEESAISVSGGNLRLTGSKKSNPFSGWTHNGGLVRSVNNVTYGYFESRMKANKTFLSSTFWLINKRNEGTGCDVRVTELDITETVGWNTGGHAWIENNMKRMNSNNHSRNTTCSGTPVGQQGGNAELGEYAYQGYHIYGVWWKSKSELLFYLDNQYQFTITPPADFDLPMYLRMVVESYDWNPPKDGDDGMNGSFDQRTTYYDWTRSWRLVDDNTPGDPETVSCDMLPSTVASGSSIQVTVPYQVNQNRDVVVEFWNAGWLGQGTTTVGAGTGNAMVTIPLSSPPATGSNYLFKTSIRPVGSGWTGNINTCQKNDVVVTNGSPGQSPYGGSNHSIPGMIEAEHYDVGGEGVAYHDTSGGNAGGLVRSDDVDIESRDGGHSVGWTANGEWLEYTINTTTGSYDLEARVAATSADKRLVVKLDGTTLGTINVPNTGGWGNFQTVGLNDISISGGNNKILRIEFVGGGVNLNWLDFATAASPVLESVDCTPLPTSLASQSSYTISVPYVASQSRDIVVEFWDTGWIAQGTSTVPGGSGNATVTVNLPSAPGSGSNYLWKASIRPVGADWTQNIDACNQGNVQVSASCDIPYTAPNITVNQQTVNWSSGLIDISCASSVNLSLTAAGTGPMENSDYLNIYYKINGGAPMTLLETTNSYASNNLAANGLSGNTLEIIVNGYTSWSDEIYNVSNISVVNASGARQSMNNAIEIQLDDLIEMYPNPVTSASLNIVFHDQSNPVDVKIFDLNGKTVFTRKRCRGELSIHRGQLPSQGIYYARFFQNGHITIKKLILE